MRVLVVDDSFFNLKAFKRNIESKSIKVDVLNNGNECLKRVKYVNYDIIFLDIMMPDIDGVETFRKLKSYEDFKTPVIALSAEEDEIIKERLLRIGFSDFLLKPTNKQDILKIIHKFIEL